MDLGNLVRPIKRKEREKVQNLMHFSLVYQQQKMYLAKKQYEETEEYRRLSLDVEKDSIESNKIHIENESEGGIILIIC